MSTSLEKPIYDLLQTEPFFANFLLGAKITLNDPKVKRAAVALKQGQITFYFNSDFMGSIPREGQVAVLKHEVFHVLLEHCGKRGGDHRNREAKNVAMDCAINQFITNLPGDCVTLGYLEKLCKRPLGAFESWEYYYAALKEAAKNAPKPLPGAGEAHDHDVMTIESDEISEAEEALNRASVKDAASKAVAACAGNIPKEIAAIIGEMNKIAQLPWKQILRNFVAKARSISSKPSRLKPHRRFDLDQPGKKKLKKLVLGVCTDSSGSVSDESYSKFLNEIHTIAKGTTITYLVHADCAVQRVDVIKGGKPKGNVLKERHGAGGTAYQPAITECVKRGCDAIIYFGDFDCADTPLDPGVPVLWVGVGEQPPPASFGNVLRLT